MTDLGEQLDVLFVSEAPPWPLDQGFCIRGYHMARTLCQMGVRVGVSSHAPLPPDAPAALHEMSRQWPETDAHDLARFLAGWSGPGWRLRRRLASHQGRDLARFAGIVPLVERHRPDTVIGLGQHSPMMLRALTAQHCAKRVWYAADELVNFHLTCLRHDRLADAPHRLRLIALYAALERSFVPGIDGAIGVSPAETKLLRRFAGARSATTIRNGVDTEYFSPADTSTSSKDLVFWGRMDFEPNIDAVCWFARRVLPALEAVCPSARLKIIGKKPHDRVIALGELHGVDVVGPVPDIRPYAQSAGITILPMRSGAGIKNKLLEAAAMGRPIVASPRAVRGLKFDGSDKPLLVCGEASEWVATIRRLWSDASRRRRLGESARHWVVRHHSWRAAAGDLMRWTDSLSTGSPAPDDECTFPDGLGTLPVRGAA